MKITIMGASHGVPEPHRRCSATMIEVAGKYYFIDMGMSVMDELAARHISINDVRAIFVTHMHGDHTNGLVPLVDLISWYYKNANPAIYLPNPAAGNLLAQWLDMNGVPSYRADMHKVEEGVIFDDGDIKITAIPTQHIVNSFAFLLEAEGKTVLFTGDLKNPTIDFPTVGKERETDLIICEAAHFPTEDYIPVLSACTTKKVVVTHYITPHIAGVAALNTALSVPVILANDNMEITV